MPAHSISRRRFIALGAAAAGLVALGQPGDAATTTGPGVRPPETALRPPGAGPDFLARCIRCGKCMEACPYGSIRAMGAEAGALLHTPYIDPLKTPCYVCRHRGPEGRDRAISSHLLCGAACPTGALTKIPNEIEVLSHLPHGIKPGLSVLQRHLCLAWEYDSCGECYYNCPLKDRALRDRPPGEDLPPKGIRPWVDEEGCIGCGMCSFVCPVKEHVASAHMRRDVRLTLFEERYAAMVRNVVGRAGQNVRLPAAYILRRS